MNNSNINFTGEQESNEYAIAYEYFKKIPYKTTLHAFFNKDQFLTLIENKNIELINQETEIIPFDEENIKTEYKFIKIISNNSDIFISFFMEDDTEDISGIKIYHNDIIEEFLEDVDECRISHQEEIVKDNILSIRDGMLEIDPIHYDHQEDIDMFYSKNSFKKVKKLLRNMSNIRNNITILCGERGTGKTQLLKHIANNSDRLTIFIPNNLVDHSINNPEFINLISRYGSVLLMIDDCEFMTNSQYSKMNYFTSNVIQMTESILSEKNNIHLILTFNTKRKDVDQNLLDCNSIYDVIEIDHLSSEEANDLREHLRMKKLDRPGKLRDVLKKQIKNKVNFGL